MILAELLQEASDKTNLIAATHSSELISYLNPDEVVAMDTNIDGLAFATWADSLDLRAWLEDYHLGELWNMGRIGARHEAVG